MKKRTSLSLDKKMIEKVDLVCNDLQISRSQFVETALAVYLFMNSTTSKENVKLLNTLSKNHMHKLLDGFDKLNKH